MMKKKVYEAICFANKRNWLTRSFLERFRNRLFLNQKSSKDRLYLSDRYIKNQWDDLENVWFFSTGRAGTALLNDLLNLSPYLSVFHEPPPTMFNFSKDVYDGKIELDDGVKILGYLRDEFVHRTNYNGQVYVETNNRAVYVADIIKARFPLSRFVHVYRNPYDVIRSGMRREWYKDNNCDYYRMEPLKSEEYYDDWKEMTQIEKNAWHWMMVNKLSLKIKTTLPEKDFFSLAVEDVYSGNYDIIHDLYEFIREGYFPSKWAINKVLSKKINSQNRGAFPYVRDWDKEDLKSVNVIISDVASTLGYAVIE